MVPCKWLSTHHLIRGSSRRRSAGNDKGVCGRHLLPDGGAAHRAPAQAAARRGAGAETFQVYRRFMSLGFRVRTGAAAVLHAFQWVMLESMM
jgi:hypothetical protein